MFVYLSKKIAIPQGGRLVGLSWNGEQGWIAVGGGGGLLKVLQLDDSGGEQQLGKGEGAGGGTAAGPASGEGRATNAAAASGALLANQTLEGHSGAVLCATWNENYRKLTTSDESGLIIVWMLHKGLWFEEMINNRNKSVVRDMTWTQDGTKICIAYGDGAVIVGAVDGNRMWGKELEHELANVEWSPSGRSIIFGTANGELLSYDAAGVFIRKCPVTAVEPNSGARTVSIDWYGGRKGYVAPNAPSLAVGFDNGRVQIMRDETDEEPVLLDTGLAAVAMRWNGDGSVLAIAGSAGPPSGSGGAAAAAAASAGGGAPSSSLVVQFYDPFGSHLRTLKIPGQVLSSISWDGTGLRLAMTVDSNLFFANVRPDYKWGYFSGTVVYAYNQPDREESCVVFWDTQSGERHMKYVKKLLQIRAAGEHCVLATHDADVSGQYILVLCNTIGSPLTSRYVSDPPTYLAMSTSHVVAASDSNIFVWQYALTAAEAAASGVSSTLAAAAAAASSGAQRNARNVGIERLTRDGREVTFHVDGSPDVPAFAAASSRSPGGNNGGGEGSGPDGGGAGARPRVDTEDPVVAVTLSESMLIVARSSGTLLRYSLPQLRFEQRYAVMCRPQKVALNCESRRLAVIDIQGSVLLLDLESRPVDARGMPQDRGEVLKFARKDAWDVLWSSDNPELFATMEKTRMYVFRGLHPEEPVTSTGYLCEFSDLCIRAVLLDAVMADPEKADPSLVVEFETKSLRDTRDLLATTPIAEAYQFIEDHPHPRLWRLLAETALEQLDFVVADRAFVHCLDYPGIQFVKRLKLMKDRNRQRAEVAAYFRRFDEAENILLEMGSKELAVELRMRLGDWARVVQLISSGGAGDDRMLNAAYNNMGDYYADRQKWGKAFKYFAKASNLRSMTECAYMLDNYTTLRKIVAQVPDGSDYLRDIGEKFMSVGLCSEAVAAFEALGDAQAAINCCVTLNQWDQAVALAERHRFPQIEGLLAKYAGYLLQKDSLFQAVELYRKAGFYLDASRLLIRLAREASTVHQNPVRAKQLYVLAGLEADKHRKKLLAPGPGGASLLGQGAAKSAAMQTLSTLLQADAPSGDTRRAGAGSGSGSGGVGGGAAGAVEGANNSFTPDSPWQGAEAYHFFLLAQRQIYDGDLAAALRTSLRLREYEAVLPAKVIYSLVAVTAFHCRMFGQCSRAFARLETQTGVESAEVERYRRLALAIFVRSPPVDPKSSQYRCPNPKCEGVVTEWDTACSSCNAVFPACVATGRAILSQETHTCSCCRHRIQTIELARFRNCPLCHAAFHSGEGSSRS